MSRAEGMRVLMTADTVGGVWTYAIDLINALRPHGVSVVLATMGGPLSAAQRRQADAIDGLVLRESSLKLEWMNDPWDDVRRAGDWLAELEAEFRPDVVHLNGYTNGNMPFDAPTMVVAHSCCLSWWEAVKREPPPSFWDRYRAAVEDGLNGADVWVAPSEAMRTAVERHYRPQTPSRVIYNGRAGGRFAPGEKRDVIFSAGRVWDEAKNLSALVAVAGAVPWPIAIAGNAEHPDGGTVESHGVSHLGVLDESAVAARMAAASIYALPAKYEPFGLSALEAALCGCALVLGDIDSLREIWGDAAVYVDPTSPSELGHALRTLIDRPAERRALAARSLARAQRYRIETTAAAYLEEYERLASRPMTRSTERVKETVE